MILINKTKNEIICENLKVADSFFKRLKGLMFTKELSHQDGLQIIPCNQIHTFFMNYNIDILYLDINNKIISIDENIPKRKIGKWVKNAFSVIELPMGTIKKRELTVGQTVVKN